MTELLNGFLSGSAAWGVMLTLAAFALGTLINRATGKAIFNPLLLGSIFVIILLSVLNIPYADYKSGPAGGVEGVHGLHQADGADGDQIVLLTGESVVFFAMWATRRRL